MFSLIYACLIKLVVLMVNSFSVYRRSRLLFSSQRAHISEIIGAVAAHISSQASPVFGTSAKKIKNVENFQKKSENVRTLPNASERIRTCPNASGKVRTGPNTSPNLRKLRKTCENFAKTSRKLRERRVRAVVGCRI